MTDPKLHKLAITMIKRGDRITLDFTGTDPQSTGPINWPADYAGGAFLIKWIAPILRNLADTPERAAEIHVNEGVCEVFDLIFPPKGTLITPEWPAATNARSFVLLRCLGLLAGVVAQAVDGRMPADQETIRYTGFYGTDETGKSFLSREVLGGGSGWSRSSRCARIRAAPASGAAGSATKSITARWWTAGPSSRPIECGSAATV